MTDGYVEGRRVRRKGRLWGRARSGWDGRRGPTRGATPPATPAGAASTCFGERIRPCLLRALFPATQWGRMARWIPAFAGMRGEGRVGGMARAAGMGEGARGEYEEWRARGGYGEGARVADMGRARAAGMRDGARAAELADGAAGPNRGRGLHLCLECLQRLPDDAPP